eukprot:CAMPEP_0167760924 /NCGR_PEP_ID=MMETSP0110_2-20121227/11865_1 /TAXON_ID=629695 /ORGANISM="Gymnochlora sp., Strain CCMP2014" /LENGTH=295 /DNA_ID=CAMNT_0007647507 /DNA_START=113 /DNA_END=1000 /DNA_ORIENTATION=+
MTLKDGLVHVQFSEYVKGWHERLLALGFHVTVQEGKDSEIDGETIMGFGMHRNKPYKEVPEDYKDWAVEVRRPNGPLKMFVRFVKQERRKQEKLKRPKNFHIQQSFIAARQALLTVLPSPSMLRLWHKKADTKTASTPANMGSRQQQNRPIPARALAMPTSNDIVYSIPYATPMSKPYGAPSYLPYPNGLPAQSASRLYQFSEMQRVRSARLPQLQVLQAQPVSPPSSQFLLDSDDIPPPLEEDSDFEYGQEEEASEVKSPPPSRKKRTRDETPQKSTRESTFHIELPIHKRPRI